MKTTTKAHFANVFFETDLDGRYNNIYEAISSHPNFLQLQYLPTLYQKDDEITLVTHLAENARSVALIEPKTIERCFIEPWGISECLLKDFNSSLSILNDCPLETVKELSSKLWSFKYLQAYVKDAVTLTINQEVDSFLKILTFPAVFKTPQGFSGRGNLVVYDLEKEKQKLEKWLLDYFGCQLIVEPWLERTVDFSTQWYITDNDISCLGATVLVNTERGSYLGNQFFPNDPFLLIRHPQVEEHYTLANKILQEIQRLGFRGNLGIDAFFYKRNGVEQLLPIVEINPRKTMGFVTLQFAKNQRFEKNILMKLSDNKDVSHPLLPTEIKYENKIIKFKKNLSYELF